MFVQRGKGMRCFYFGLSLMWPTQPDVSFNICKKGPLTLKAEPSRLKASLKKGTLVNKQGFSINSIK